MTEHRQRCDNHGQRQRPPESPREVDELGVLLVLESGKERLERHSADRAVARRIAADLRMHRTRVDRLARGWRWCEGARLGVFGLRCAWRPPVPVAVDYVLRVR